MRRFGKRSSADNLPSFMGWRSVDWNGTTRRRLNENDPKNDIIEKFTPYRSPIVWFFCYFIYFIYYLFKICVAFMSYCITVIIILFEWQVNNKWSQLYLLFLRFTRHFNIIQYHESRDGVINRIFKGIHGQSDHYNWCSLTYLIM